MSDNSADTLPTKNFSLFLNTIADLCLRHGFVDTNAGVERRGARFTYSLTMGSMRDTPISDEAPIRVFVKIDDLDLDKPHDPYAVYQLLPSKTDWYSVKDGQVLVSIKEVSAYLMTVLFPLIDQLEATDKSALKDEWEKFGFYGEANSKMYGYHLNLATLQSFFDRESATRAATNYFKSLSKANQETFSLAYLGTQAFPVDPNEKGWHADSINISYPILTQTRRLDLIIDDIKELPLGTNKPLINVTAETLEIDGKSLAMPFSFKEATEILGEPRFEEYNDKDKDELPTATWDDLGLMAVAHKDNKDYIGGFTVLIESNREQTKSATFHTDKAFEGTLLIEGRDYRRRLFIDVLGRDDFSDLTLDEKVYIMGRIHPDLSQQRIIRVVIAPFNNPPRKKFSLFGKK